MTFQSTFLIRCRIAPQATGAPLVNYIVHHVQTGVEFPACTLAEINGWIETVNLEYLKTLQSSTPDTPERG